MTESSPPEPPQRPGPNDAEEPGKHQQDEDGDAVTAAGIPPECHCPSPFFHEGPMQGDPDNTWDDTMDVADPVEADEQGGQDNLHPGVPGRPDLPLHGREAEIRGPREFPHSETDRGKPKAAQPDGMDFVTGEIGGERQEMAPHEESGTAQASPSSLSPFFHSGEEQEDMGSPRGPTGAAETGGPPPETHGPAPK